MNQERKQSVLEWSETTKCRRLLFSNNLPNNGSCTERERDRVREEKDRHKNKKQNRISFCNCFIFSLVPTFNRISNTNYWIIEFSMQSTRRTLRQMTLFSTALWTCLFYLSLYSGILIGWNRRNKMIEKLFSVEQKVICCNVISKRANQRSYLNTGSKNHYTKICCNETCFD